MEDNLNLNKEGVPIHWTTEPQEPTPEQRELEAALDKADERIAELEKQLDEAWGEINDLENELKMWKS